MGPIGFRERVNLITGDNGLGKSFLLDVAWRVLTGTWAGDPPIPRFDVDLLAQFKTDDLPAAAVAGHWARRNCENTWHGSIFDFETFRWHKGGRPDRPEIILYYRVDGDFLLMDSWQMDWYHLPRAKKRKQGAGSMLRIRPNEAWNGIRASNGNALCRGLIEDWITWQCTNSPEFELLTRVLGLLSPPGLEKLIPGEPTPAPWLRDRRLLPTIDLPYGRVPVMLASAGMQRILMLAYLLMWSWEGHLRACQLIRREPERSIVVLLDEPERHLHPRWQRTLVPSLLEAVGALRNAPDVQLLISTHSPLVLSSMEPIFDASKDQLIELSLDEQTGQVDINSPEWTTRGDVNAWLVSDTFGLRQARSVPAEIAIEAAKRFMGGDASKNPSHLQTREQIHGELARLLGDVDPFWPRWIVTTEMENSQ